MLLTCKQMTRDNPNLDIVNVNAYTTFGQILYISFLRGDISACNVPTQVSIWERF